MFFDKLYFYLSLRYHLYKYRKDNWWHAMDDHVLLGGLPLHEYNDQKILMENYQVKAVLSFNEDFELEPSLAGTPVTPNEWKENQVVFFQIPTRDGCTPSLKELETASHFIQSAHGRVYVHCKAGVGRSAMAVMAYCIDQKGFTARQCKQWIQSQRPQLNLSPMQWETIKNYETRRHLELV